MTGRQTPPPAVRLRVAALRVVPGGTPEAPRAYYSLALDSADPVAPGDAAGGALTYAALDGDPALLQVGDVVTLYLGDYVPEEAAPHAAASREAAPREAGRRTSRGG